MSSTRLLAALDQTIAAVQLARLIRELTTQRAAIADGAALDPEWAGQLVRWVAEWIPESELPLLARLGGIARAGRGT